MTGETDLYSRFLELHRPGSPLVMPNPWDIGTAKLFASLGFGALATTSSGFAATLGRLDGGVTRAEALEHSTEIAAATSLLESCWTVVHGHSGTQRRWVVASERRPSNRPASTIEIGR